MIVVNSYRFGKLDVATQALLDQAATDGYTAASGSILTALDTYIKELKTAGIWSLMDVIYLPATNGDIDFACYNLKDPSQFKLFRGGGLTFTTLQGFTGNGTNSYLNTQWNPIINGVNYTQNSASYGIYRRVAGSDTNAVNIGLGTSQNFFSQNNSTQGRYRINTGSDTTVLIANSDVGMLHFNRSSSSNIQAYKNGININNSVRTSLMPTSAGTALLLTFTAGSLASRDQISNAFFAADLSSVALQKYNAIQNYMTALGTQV